MPPFLLRKAAVLGAGNMGSRIAAHLANAGIPVVLLDIAADDGQGGRNRIVNAALEALSKSKPAAFFEPSLARFITTGNFDDDLEKLRECDWIIEAVSENLDIKRGLLAKIAPFRNARGIVTTNTSGLPIKQIAEMMDGEFRRHWFGTHFFNPPRYMRLLEIIPGADTDPDAIEFVRQFASTRLGKTIVMAKDTPNFIGNRIGIFVMASTIGVMQEMDLTIEQVDALTGSVLGWPKTGTFRLADMVGLDVLAHVAVNLAERITGEAGSPPLPDFIGEMLQRKWLGDKAGRGFYKKTKDASGSEVRLGLDWKTLEYRPSERAKFPLLDFVKNAESLSERIKLLLARDPRKDRAAEFYWRLLPAVWNYSAQRVPEIADSIASIDLAMKAGFNWEMGPFEMWDAAGVSSTVEKMKAAGIAVAPGVEALLASGYGTWYRDDPAAPSGRAYFDIASAAYKPLPLAPGTGSVQLAKKSHGIVKENPGASLIDLGDGVACLEFHTKMNSIGSDILSLVTQTLRPGGDAMGQFEAFVITSDAANFSAGANLMQLLLAIQEQEWDDVEAVIRSFQAMTQAIKFCPRPVVVAPFGLCLGGGAEVTLHGAARQAHAELYMGLVETGVGLIPAGGGCKEMVLHAMDEAGVREGSRSDSVELMDALRRRFETVAMAKVSTSATEARTMDYLSSSDVITMNRDRLLHDAKHRACEMAKEGYSAPLPRTAIPAPGENVLASLKMGVRLMREGEYISDHDVKIANWLAYILCGGNVTPGTPVGEQYFLDLERQAFLSLCGEPKTAERIAHTLKTGKPLRN
ncbi:MAG TPA: 3-hydroxyacyl-CoA dehydrogenase NAD-binding domain-containing protein [Bryobacteraceae bacterium]|jgi:3-hydroxyacyl-CoA dehydrogenase|nr:3-hydroxyacyl-CoA dehydrogenase NAD-binding domain-containing protein [Bryobacteraceae bacterium]